MLQTRECPILCEKMRSEEDSSERKLSCLHIHRVIDDGLTQVAREVGMEGNRMVVR
jgi:hypothetical protein